MLAGQVNKAHTMAVKIGAAIIRFDRTEMVRTDVTMNSKSMWAKVRKLTGCNRVYEGQGQSCVVKLGILDHHHPSISRDPSHVKPEVRMTANQRNDNLLEWRMLNILNIVLQTATN